MLPPRPRSTLFPYTTLFRSYRITAPIRLTKQVIMAGAGFTDDPTPELRAAAVLLKDGNFERSEEHTSELQSRQYLVCRLLLEKKKKTTQGQYREHTERSDCN